MDNLTAGETRVPLCLKCGEDKEINCVNTADCTDKDCFFCGETTRFFASSKDPDLRKAIQSEGF